MPRDIGSGLYHYPEGTPGIPGQTVFSARYNTFIDDLSNTLNQKLPLNMGGTGADNASMARDNIDAEVSGAQVTNYNTHVFENGSFWSNTGAIGGPIAATPFWGFAYGIDANNINITARYGDKQYNRVKFEGVWGGWTDSMTLGGDLIIDKAFPAISLSKQGTTDQPVIWGVSKAGTSTPKKRWAMVLGHTSPEPGASAGTDFQIYRYNDAGDQIGVNPAFSIARNSGVVGLYGSTYIIGGDLSVQTTGTQGTIKFGTDPLKSIWYDGTDFHITGGNLFFDTGKGVTCGPITATTGTFSGAVGCGALTPTSINTGPITATTISGTVIGGTTVSTTSFMNAKAAVFIDGTDAANSPSIFFRNESLVEKGYVFWDRALDEMVMQPGTGVACKWRVGTWGVASTNDAVYKPTGGPWVTSSDARIKTVHGDYQHGLDEVLALRPVIYSFLGNDQFGKVYSEDPKASLHSNITDKQCIGLVAQECETAMPEMVAQVPGFIDGQAVTDLRTLDTGPLVFALVNAVKELTARIATLEAAQATP